MPTLYRNLLFIGVGILALSMACGGGGGASSAATPTPGFNLSASPNGVHIPAGGSGYALVSVVRENGSTGDITLGLSGLPIGVTATGAVLDGTSSGRLIIMVAGKVMPQTLGNLILTGQDGKISGITIFSLTIDSALAASNLPTDRVNASGGEQRNGTMVNTGFAIEPVAHMVSSSISGVAKVRNGFLPVPSPSVP